MLLTSRLLKRSPTAHWAKRACTLLLLILLSPAGAARAGRAVAVGAGGGVLGEVNDGHAPARPQPLLLPPRV
jgi:hypothetical protein